MAGDEGPDWGVMRWAQAGAVFFSREWLTTHSDLRGAQRIACFPHEEPVISLNTRLSACSLVSCSGRLDWALGVVTQRDTGCPLHAGFLEIWEPEMNVSKGVQVREGAGGEDGKRETSCR